MNFLMMFMITKNSVERARVFKYKLLLFASYYNTISNKEAKSSFSKYGPNRKMLNDIKLRLFGNKTDTASGKCLPFNEY